MTFKSWVKSQSELDLRGIYIREFLISFNNGSKRSLKTEAVNITLPLCNLTRKMLSFVTDAYKTIRRMNFLQLGLQCLNFVSVVTTAFMMWKALSVVTNNESPIVVVLSESMSPAFERGDILFLTMHSNPLKVGDICVFNIKGREIPIVHRIHKIHEAFPNGPFKVLTKGDNNEVHDRGLYNRGQKWLENGDIVGRVKGNTPYLGLITIIMNDFPQVKFLILAVLGTFVLINRDQ